MKKQDIKTYIEQFLNKLEAKEEQAEVPNAILLLSVYMAGLKKEQFPLDLVGKEDGLDIGKELPAQFHTLTAQLAIKKSKIEQRTNDIRIIEILNRNMSKLLEDFRNYTLSAIIGPRS